MKYFLYIIILFFVIQNSYAQNRNYYNKLKSSKKNSIEYSKKMLKELRSDNRFQLERLLIIEGQIRKEKELYKIIDKELKLLDDELYVQKTKIQSLESKLKHQKNEYAKLINFTWLNINIQNRMIYVLSANSFNNAYKRILYLKQLSDFRKATGKNIQKSILELDSIVSGLEILKKEKVSLTGERKVVLDSLSVVKKKFDKMIASNNSEIAAIRSKMIDNQSKRANVDKRVTAHINKQVTASKSKASVSSSGGTKKFRSLKRQHIWPLRKFVILHRFGDYRHPKFKNVVIKNDGVELAAEAGSNVHAIYKGKVTNIIDIPGEGYSIIIRHGDFYSVYANVVKPEVKLGSVVEIGQVIAYLKKDEKMTKMNFQLWHGKTKLNPKLWLKRV